MKRKEITLHIIYDCEKYDDPVTWPWKEILGWTHKLVEDRASVRVTKAVNVNDLGIEITV